MNVLFLFGLYLLMFALIGLMRGWARELLLTFAMVISLALLHLMDKYIPIINNLPRESTSLFWIRMIILVAMLYFGYRTVVEIPALGDQARAFESRGRLTGGRNRLFGLLMGLLNGYLFAGAGFFYLNATGSLLFSFVGYSNDDITVQMVQNLMAYMPPVLLGEPWIYFAVVVGLVVVLYVYI